MNNDFAIRLDGFGGAGFCVEDDPFGSVLDDEHQRRLILAHSLDDFWLKIRSR